mmetsp:Transcript_73730/g.124231  ORF Transcript_73730/g.124231 Transcript_73730/m.124231 type:complete len:319 (+) Transcript_73730:1387-2343(+)
MPHHSCKQQVLPETVPFALQHAAHAAELQQFVAPAAHKVRHGAIGAVVEALHGVQHEGRLPMLPHHLLFAVQEVVEHLRAALLGRQRQATLPVLVGALAQAGVRIGVGPLRALQAEGPPLLNHQVICVHVVVYDRHVRRVVAVQVVGQGHICTRVHQHLHQVALARARCEAQRQLTVVTRVPRLEESPGGAVQQQVGAGGDQELHHPFEALDDGDVEQALSLVLLPFVRKLAEPLVFLHQLLRHLEACLGAVQEQEVQWRRTRWIPLVQQLAILVNHHLERLKVMVQDQVVPSEGLQRPHVIPALLRRHRQFRQHNSH